MRFKLTVLIALLASLLLASSAISADLTKKATSAKGASAVTHTTDSNVAPRPSNLPPVGSRGSHGGLDEIIISEDFEAYASGELPPGWAQVDVDGGYCAQEGIEHLSTWRVDDIGAQYAHSGTKVIWNHYNSDGSQNDDWLIIPVGVLEAPISFSYWTASQLAEYLESYELKVSTTGLDPADFTNMIADESDIPVAWTQHTHDLSAFADAPFYIAFHYTSTDEFIIKLDDVVLEGTPGTADMGSLAGTVTDSETSNPLSGVNVSVIGSTESGNTDASGDYTIDDIIVGTYTVRFTKDGYDPTEVENVAITIDATTPLDVTMTETFVPPTIENDDCSDPYALPAGEGVYPYSTSNATVDASIAALPTDQCNEGNGVVFAADVWMTWTATSDGSLTISTCNDANYDTRLACYSNGTATCPGCPTTNADLIACNDDAAGCGTTSTMLIDAEADACYLIRVGGWNTATGSGNLTIAFEGEPMPILTMSPDSLGFGPVEVGQSDDMTFTLGNDGNFNLLVTSITVTDGFDVDEPATSVTPGATRPLVITFAPTSTQQYVGTITLVSNDPNSPHVFPITGEGTTDVDDYAGVVDEYYVATSFPNPFNPETTISFAIPKSEMVSVVVFNMVGQEVAVLNNGRLDAGIHNFTFNGTDLPSGLYFTRIEADGFTQTLKNVLMK